ncbi:MAG: spore germination protein [Sulfobacillus sp.]
MDRNDLNDIAHLAQEATQIIDAMTMPHHEQYVPDMESAYQRIKAEMGSSPDVILRYLQVPACQPHRVLIAYIDGLTDSQMVDQDIIAPLLQASSPADQWDQTTIRPGHISPQRHWTSILQDLAGGNTIIFAPGLAHVWSVDTVKFKERAIGRPHTELSVRGPNEAFNEDVYTQMSQLRRRFFDPALHFHEVTLGRLQNSAVMVAYIEGLTNPSLVDAVKMRLERVRIDGKPNATVIGGLIRDHPRTIFPTIRSTERVDVASMALLEGRVVICVDADPFVLIAPAPLIDFYRTAMDYSDAWYDTSFIRLIRLLGWGMGVYLPSLYIALTEVNTNLLPPSLLIVTGGDHAGLPFPPIVEALLMVFVIEVLREAALRLPKALSTTIGTVGGIVVGTAVVKAGLVSPQMIVVITLTALSFYSVPVYELTGTWRLMDFLMLMLAAVLGIYGIILATIWMVGTLISLDSFGVPYFSPFAPFRVADWIDVLVRVPWTLLRHRTIDARPTPSRWMGSPTSTPPPHLRKMRP